MIAPTTIALKLALWALLHLPFVLALGWLARRQEARVLLWWALAAALGAAATGRFYTHYFLELLPPLCVALALALRGIAGARAVKIGAVSLALASPLLCLPLTGPIRQIAAHGLGAALAGQDLPARLARRIRELAGPGPAPGLYVFDHEPALYLLLGAPAPGPYLFPPHVTRAHFTRVAAIDPVAELERMMAGPPEFVVKRERPDGPLTDDHFNAEVIARLAGLLAADYVLVDRLEGVEIWRRKPRERLP